MLYTRNLCQMLGIPETVDDPTAYDVLQLPPFGLTREQVEAALIQQTHRLYLSVQDAAMVPVVRRVARELERAAGLLLDEGKCKEHDDAIAASVSLAYEPDFQQRRSNILNAMSVIEQATIPDGALESDQRSGMEQQLAELGLDNKQVKRLMLLIPGPADENQNLREDVVGFFVDAMNLSAQLQSLDEDETALVGLGQALGFPTGVVGALIRDAKIGPLSAQAVEHVLAQSGGFDAESDVAFTEPVAPVEAPMAMSAPTQTAAPVIAAEVVEVESPRRTRRTAKSAGSGGMGLIVGVVVAAVVVVGGGGVAYWQLVLNTPVPKDSQQTGDGDNPDDRQVLKQRQAELRQLEQKAIEGVQAVEGSSGGQQLRRMITDAKAQLEQGRRLLDAQQWDQSRAAFEQALSLVNDIELKTAQRHNSRTAQQQAGRARARALACHGDGFAANDFIKAQELMTQANAMFESDQYQSAITAWQQARDLYKQAYDKALAQSAP